MQPNYTTNDYNIYFVDSNNKDFYFPYIFCVPKHLNNEGALSLYVETNNEEKSEKLIDSAEFTTRNVLNMMRGSANKSPIFIPILPTNGKDARPYFQQLSNECFNTNLPTGEQRIDLQVKKAIEDAKLKFYEITGKKLEDKIFMHGYSASGVFAQRFALIHPEMIKEVVIGVQ